MDIFFQATKSLISNYMAGRSFRKGFAARFVTEQVFWARLDWVTLGVL